MLSWTIHRKYNDMSWKENENSAITCKLYILMAGSLTLLPTEMFCDLKGKLHQFMDFWFNDDV